MATTEPTVDPRAAYTAGLRALADLLDAHPDLPLPVYGDLIPMTLGFYTPDARERIAAAVRLFPGTKMKRADDDYFRIDVALHGLSVQLTALRHDVCERVVVGTTEVVVEEPDPDAVAALPKVMRTEVVEQVEWICSPLLSDAEPEPVAS